MKKAKKPFDKYYWYTRAVQSPESDVEFLSDTYKELRGTQPEVLREDFCGGFALACEWVKANSKHRALGIDLDPEPIEYGRTHYLPKLTPGQQSRIQIYQQNVLSADVPPADVIAAMNFSYFLFKKRSELIAYFAQARRGLRRKGLFIIDCFGGSMAQEANEERTKHRDFTYYWDQDSFDPVTNEGMFYIHFKLNGEKKRQKVFTYDWRIWTIPELRECLEEAGFQKTHVYWEGTTKSGEGDGKFTRTEKGEECESWIAYIVAE